MVADDQAREQQRRAYLEGEWGNPLTTNPTGGRILSAIQLPYFLLLPPKGYGVLTTRGRKTGKKRRRCIRAIRKDDKVFLVSLRGRFSAWYRNLMADPNIKLRMRGGTFRGTAREISDDAEREEARRAYCETITAFDRATFRAHRKGRPTPERIRALNTRWFSVCTPLVIDLHTEDPR